MLIHFIYEPICLVFLSIYPSVKSTYLPTECTYASVDQSGAQSIVDLSDLHTVIEFNSLI